ATVPGVAEIHADIAERADPALPRLDYRLPMLSAPRLFATDLTTVPAAVPYVSPDESERAAWARRLAGAKGVKGGLVWSGSPRTDRPRANIVDRRRSMPLAAMAPLLSIKGVNPISLQMGEAAEQIAELPRRSQPLDLMDQVSDFADTAALVANLDL